MSITENKNPKTKKIPNYDHLVSDFQTFLAQKNYPEDQSNGIYKRYVNPVLTHKHAPLEWRYDFNPETNPFGMERIGINATFNPGAIKWNGQYILAVRVEGNDRKSTQ